MEIPVAENADVASYPATVLESTDSGRKRFHPSVQPHVPVVVLSADGMIQHVTPSAQQLLEYRRGQKFDRSFFAHVHGRNLYQVMRDVANMVCYGKTQATWLLRMRTGRGRWRWYQATAKNLLEEDRIQVYLDEQNAW